mmetsp:Transcript_14695/g.16810  ORF Transcript_14695/g.16810 Transcript_14695/m.16810 type:complete len:279 (+) Transcript_14695:1082-1918(+)
MSSFASADLLVVLPASFALFEEISLAFFFGCDLPNISAAFVLILGVAICEEVVVVFKARFCFSFLVFSTFTTFDDIFCFLTTEACFCLMFSMLLIGGDIFWFLIPEFRFCFLVSILLICDDITGFTSGFRFWFSFSVCTACDSVNSFPAELRFLFLFSVSFSSFRGGVSNTFNIVVSKLFCLYSLTCFIGVFSPKHDCTKRRCASQAASKCRIVSNFNSSSTTSLCNNLSVSREGILSDSSPMLLVSPLAPSLLSTSYPPRPLIKKFSFSFLSSTFSL